MLTLLYRPCGVRVFGENGWAGTRVAIFLCRYLNASSYCETEGEIIDIETWGTIIGIIIPIVTIAGSSVAFVVKLYRDAHQRRQQRFFELMGYIDQKGTIASKLAAAYQLRDFPEHDQFIIRFCNMILENIEGDSAESLKAELRETIEYFR